MRVQAKRVQSNKFLRIKHKVASSGIQQRELLIDGAIEDNMKPIYCIYSTERQRGIWKQARETAMSKDFQAGCLLADASDVPLTTRRLVEIEDKCIPWHYLFSRYAFVHEKIEFLKQADHEFQKYHSVSHTPVPTLRNGNDMHQTDSTGWNAPTIDDLNEDTGRDFDRAGVRETTNDDLERLRPEKAVERNIVEPDQDRLHKRGIQRMMVMDVREESGSER